MPLAPVITESPSGLTLATGAGGVLEAKATYTQGTGVFSAQWFKDGSAITAQNNLLGSLNGLEATVRLSFPTVSKFDAGTYFCRFASSYGYADTAAATLIVTDAGDGSGGGVVRGPVGTLGSPLYSGAASSFAAFLAESYSTEGVYYDSADQWTTAQPDGMSWPEFPFASEGEQATAITKRRYMQRAAYFQPTALGTYAPWNASLLLIEEDNFKLEGGGIVSWTRTYSTLPRPRDMYESHSYGFQYLEYSYSYSSSQPVGGTGGSGSFSSSLTLKETAFEVSSRVRVEYFHVRDRASYPPLLAPRLIQLSETQILKRGDGDLGPDPSAPGLIVSKDAEILAEDSKERMWRYPFMERRSRYIAGPNTAFWGSALNITIPAASNS